VEWEVEWEVEVVERDIMDMEVGEVRRRETFILIRERDWRKERGDLGMVRAREVSRQPERDLMRIGSDLSKMESRLPYKRV
jgi:hypothetical protein